MTMRIIKINKTSIESDVKKCLKEIGYIPKKNKVFIKPNIVSIFKPESPCITNPKVVAGIIDYLHDLGINDIIIGEGSVSPEFNKVVDTSGYSKLCKEKNVGLLNLYKTPRRKYNFLNGPLFLPKILDEYEYINVAKLKTHIQTTVSLCIKNQKGLLNIKDRKLFHKTLHKSIAELYKMIQPDLSIIDASNGLEGNGPGVMGKEIKNLNLLILGDDSWEVDAVATWLMGIKLSTVKHLTLINKNSNKIRKYLREIKRYQKRFKLPSATYKFLKITYEWSENTCSGCSSKMSLIKQEAFRNPVLFLKLVYHSLFGRLCIITGKPENKERKGKIICIGNCSKEFALKHGLNFVQGCPPKLKDILKAI